MEVPAHLMTKVSNTFSIKKKKILPIIDSQLSSDLFSPIWGLKRVGFKINLVLKYRYTGLEFKSSN